MTREQINKHFERLNEALKGVGLPTESGEHRKGVHAGEFMFMNETEDGQANFKHIGSRNYLYLTKADRVLIPTGTAFHQGTFDQF